MSFISVAAGQPIRSTHVQQFTNWLTASKIDTPGTVACTSAAEYTLTVRSQETSSGLALAVLYGSSSSPSTVATFNKSLITLASPVKLTATSPLVLPQIDTPAPGPGAGLTSLYATTGGTLAYKAGISSDENLLMPNPLNVTGDMLYASSAIAVARLGLGTKGYGLVAGATGPQYDPFARRNRLINGDMRVSQRATMPTANDTYCLDQWNLLLEASNAATVSQETSDVPTNGSKRALKLTVGSGNNNKFGVVNFVEFIDAAELRGKTVSVQCKLKATAGITSAGIALVAWTSTADSITSDIVNTWGGTGTTPTVATNWVYIHAQPLTPTTSWATYKIENLTVSTAANNLAVFVWCDDKTTTQTTDSLLITDVQLEEGAVCTQVERIPYAESLTRCLRYVRIMGANGNGTYNAATRILISQTFDPPMRSAPTATLLSSAFQIVELGVGFQTGSGSTIVGSSLQARGAYLDIDGFSGLTTDKEIRVVSADIALFSAEL